MKRILLFILTNIAVMAVISVVFMILRMMGVDLREFDPSGNYNLGGILAISAVIGFTGSFISLLMSKFMAKRMMGVEIITEPQSAKEAWLIETVERFAKESGIKMPEVGIFPSHDVNAFATGAFRNSALVAVSTELLEVMTPNEAEAVVGHEIAHVANGDMITLTLVQGVVNTFVIFLSRIVGHFVDRVILKNEQGYGIGFYITSFIAQIVFGILASAITMWFSRYREFRADEGGAKLSGRINMIAALERLRKIHGEPEMPEQMAAFGIRGGMGEGFKKLFMSHPPLEERINALKNS
jgi:heat shock protein HtpX